MGKYAYLTNEQLQAFNDSEKLSDKYVIDKFKTKNGWKITIFSRLLATFFINNKIKLYTNELNNNSI